MVIFLLAPGTDGSDTALRLHPDLVSVEDEGEEKVDLLSILFSYLRFRGWTGLMEVPFHMP